MEGFRYDAKAIVNIGLIKDDILFLNINYLCDTK